MRRLVHSMFLVALCAALGTAGEPPAGGRPGGGRPGGGQQGGNRGGRRGQMGNFMGGGMFGGGADQTNVFDVAQRSAELAPDAALSLANLRYAREGEEHLAIAALRRQLDAKYVEQLIDIVPEDAKKPLQDVLAALNERDLAIEAAETALRTVLDDVRKRQLTKAPDANDPGQRFRRSSFVPDNKTDILRSCFTLGEGQNAAIDELRRDGFNKMRDQMRERMRALMQGGQRPAPDAFRTVFTEVRTQADDDSAKLAADLLNEAQRKDFDAACKALDTCRAATKAAEDACKAKIVKLVGEEKANTILGRGPRPQPGGGGDNNPPQMQQPPQRTQEF